MIIVAAENPVALSASPELLEPFAKDNIQILSGLKVRLWLIILSKQKKLNRVMLNGDDNENGKD